jgi:hypothetical protein
MARKKSANGSPFTYFRLLFKNDPDLLKQTSNEDILARYRSDHGLGAEARVDEKALNALSNTKSNMRRELGIKVRGRKRRRSAVAAARSTTIAPAAKMEMLENRIDDCMAFVRNLNKEGLKPVLQYLRRARNEVILLSGKPDRSA